jgi:hypothetical protein
VLSPAITGGRTGRRSGHALWQLGDSTSA